MVCLGFKPWVAGCKAQIISLRYGGTPDATHCFSAFNRTEVWASPQIKFFLKNGFQEVFSGDFLSSSPPLLKIELLSTLKSEKVDQKS